MFHLYVSKKFYKNRLGAFSVPSLRPLVPDGRVGEQTSTSRAPGRHPSLNVSQYVALHRPDPELGGSRPEEELVWCLKS